ncbi:MAG: cation transporter [Proteobacteria bacterium]|nr:MAG: cation transporter [Pseudomonadota bacterium]
MPYRYLLIVGLTLFWLILSGYWTNPLILGLGAASVALSLWMAIRIERKYAFRARGLTVLRRQHRLWPWLMVEIIKANIVVLKCIWFPKKYPISPVIRTLRMEPRSRIARTVYANAITLTPGTISIEVRNDEILVYALLEEGMEDLEEGEMGRRVHLLEGKDS